MAVVFRNLHLWYLASEVLVAGLVLMVEVTSMPNMRALMETLDLRPGYAGARLRRALADGDGSKLGFGDENSEIDLGLDSSSLAHMR